MLDVSALQDLSHEDDMQRILAVVFASALHAHRCAECGQLCTCTVVACEARRVAVLDRRWMCFRCKDAAAAGAAGAASAAAAEVVKRAACGED